ncbi:unnamed protein product [Rotaria sordida]|uniref:NHL repeat-containing protein n=1 Tax=Rotaria sordida TaxID=392033 RepID=A0A814SI34_9BILA|nr:unnamed protein product [Rotaria sordida]
MRIVYPRRCGFSPSCKQRFANVILTRFNTFAPSFPVTFIFADGRSIQLVLFACTATGAFPLVVFAPAALRTTTRAPVCSLQWNPTGTTVAGDGTPGVGPQQLTGPADVVLDPFNTLVIADTGNNRIQRWVIGAAQGVTVAGQADGGSGAGPNQLHGPTGVVVLSNGDIYVADNLNNRVQFWPAGGGAPTSLPNPPAPAPIPGEDQPAPVCSLQWNPIGTTVAGDGTPGVGLQQLRGPEDVFVDPFNTLVIADTGNNRIQRWVIGAAQGATVAGQTGGGAGAGANQLNQAGGVIVLPNGDMYVADADNNRVQFLPVGGGAVVTLPNPPAAGQASTITHGTNSSLFRDDSLNGGVTNPDGVELKFIIFIQHRLRTSKNKIISLPKFCAGANGTDVLNIPITKAGDSTSANFIAAGTYYYGCNYHPGMGATIIVFPTSTGSSSSSANSLTGSSSMLVSNARMRVGHQ